MFECCDNTPQRDRTSERWRLYARMSLARHQKIIDYISSTSCVKIAQAPRPVSRFGQCTGNQFAAKRNSRFLSRTSKSGSVESNLAFVGNWSSLRRPNSWTCWGNEAVSKFNHSANVSKRNWINSGNLTTEDSSSGATGLLLCVVTYTKCIWT